MPRALLFLTLVLTSGSGCGRSPAPSTGPLADSLDAIVGRFKETTGLPGLAVGVLMGDSVVYRAGIGVDSEGRPVTARTVFHMASVTKPFVATAVMQLVEAGRVSLDSTATRYLPDFAMKDPAARGITVRQLLTHVAGMPDVTDYRWHAPEHDAGSLARWVATLRDSSLIARPGEKWQYSNIGYEVLAPLVATVSAIPFEDYVQQRILTPVGMRSSTLLMTDIDSAAMTAGHSRDSTGTYRRNATYPYNRRHAGSSTLHSNVDDMLRWAAANIGRGSLDGQRFLPAERVEAMWKVERDITERFGAVLRHYGIELPVRSLGMGLGWLVLDHDGHRVIEHSGSDLGFTTDFLFAPDDSIGVVVLANGDGLFLLELSLSLVDAVRTAKAGEAQASRR